MELHAPATFNGAKLLGVFDNGTSEWHEVRADGIGGSEIGTILGLNRWESAFYLHHLKTGNLPQKIIDSFPADLGNLQHFGRSGCPRTLGRHSAGEKRKSLTQRPQRARKLGGVNK